MEASITTIVKNVERICQVEGCQEFTVGGRATLCRKHRNNKYKQTYKKKKRKAAGIEETQSDQVEIQQKERVLLEQRYANMLEQVLISKRLELLQSENVIQILKSHQWKVKEIKLKEMEEKRKEIENEEKMQAHLNPKTKLTPQRQQKQQLSTIQKTASLCSDNSCANSQRTSTAQAKHVKKQMSNEPEKSECGKKGSSKTNPPASTSVNQCTASVITPRPAFSSHEVRQHIPIQPASCSNIGSDNLAVSSVVNSTSAENALKASQAVSFSRQMSTKNSTQCQFSQNQTVISLRKALSTTCQNGSVSYVPASAMSTNAINTSKANRSSTSSVMSKTVKVTLANSVSGRFQAIAPATLSSTFPTAVMATRSQPVTMATPLSISKLRPIQGMPLTHIATGMPFDMWASASDSKELSTKSQQKLLNSTRQERSRALTDSNLTAPQIASSCHVTPQSSILNTNVHPATFAQAPEMQQPMITSVYSGNIFSQTGQVRKLSSIEEHPVDYLCW